MISERMTAQAKALFAVSAWGTSFMATKIVLQEVSPPTVVWLRFAIGFAVLGLLVVRQDQFAWPVRQELPHFAVLGALGITFHQWLQSNGLVTAAGSTTGWIVATGPVFISLLGWLVLRERLSASQSAGILLAGLGVVLVVSRGDLSTLFSGSFGVPGDRLILATAPNWAVFSILSRQTLQRHPAARMMLFVMGFGWLFTFVEFLGGGYQRELLGLSQNGWLWAGALGVFATGLAYIAWYDVLKALPASQAGVFLYLGPLVSMASGVLVLGESITGVTLLGGGVILIGVWLVNQRGFRSAQSPIRDQNS